MASAEKIKERQRLATEALVIGYAMSRLDTFYLKALKYGSWKDAFVDAGNKLSVPSTSVKNLRDEFDPYHPNERRGWHARKLRKNRELIMQELRDLSPDSLIELARHILARDRDSTADAIDSLISPPRVVFNVAERLLTGRRAEDYFLANVTSIVAHARESIIDYRNAARGFDFGVIDRPEIAIEIKGMKNRAGEILFTDREWTEARYRKAEYYLVIVANLAATPEHRLIMNPTDNLKAECVCQKTVTSVWRSRINLHKL
jgi:hypothetical protein